MRNAPNVMALATCRSTAVCGRRPVPGATAAAGLGQCLALRWTTDPVLAGQSRYCGTCGRERSKPEQMLKFRLLPLALEVIRKSGTAQEYRKIWQPIGKKGTDGMRAAKEVEYWGLVAIVGPRPDKIRVILRRVGTGNITFRSVMRGSKILPDGRARLAPENPEAD